MIQQAYEKLQPSERCYPLKLIQEARSAYRPLRPLFNALLQMADRGEVDRVLAAGAARARELAAVTVGRMRAAAGVA